MQTNVKPLLTKSWCRNMRTSSLATVWIEPGLSALTKRTLFGQKRACYYWHCTLSQHLRVFDYLRSNLLTDDPHYLPATQVRHVLRQIKCISWQSFTQGHRKCKEAGEGSFTTRRPSVRHTAPLHTILTLPAVCVEANYIFKIFICT